MVSIIVPTYNSEKTIDRCLDSLIGQTLKDIEIICVDNCSQDNTLFLLSSRAKRDSRIRVIAQSENKGQANSVNRGIREAKGEFVAECDSDDWVEPNMYETLLNNIECCDVIECGWFDEYEDITIGRRILNKKQILYPYRIMKGKARCAFLINQPMLLSGMYRKSYLLENDLLYREGHNFEDTSLSFKLKMLTKRYVIIPDFLYHYSKNVEGSGTKTIDDMEAIFEQYREIERVNKKFGLNLDEEIATMKFYSYRWASGRAKTIEDKDKFLRKAIKEYQELEAPKEYFLNDDDYSEYKILRGATL